jgi:alanine racemase
MVMNADETSFPSLVEYNLQPVLYSFPLLHQFENYLEKQGILNYPVHLELETGMQRLGFALSEMESLKSHLTKSQLIKIESVFSHLAASEDADEDAFTVVQAKLFQQASDELGSALPYTFLRHIANSAAVIRHPRLHLDMVRIGIGLYGVEIQTQALHLQPVAILRTTIAQLKHVKKGGTVSYNRKGKVQKDSIIATVRIGYADGYSRRLSNGVGKMWVRGCLVPVIGTVCMDMTMLDVSEVEGVCEGDEVIVFGKKPTLQAVARWAETIPYEIMTSVSQRVKRVYYQE